MTTALTRRGETRDPAKASGRCRRAAEHYVRTQFKSIGGSLVWAGYSPNTAKDPTRNGYTHDWLLDVARYWNKGTQLTARSQLHKAIAKLTYLIDHDNPQVAGTAAKAMIEIAGKEEEKEDKPALRAEEEAKWMNLIRHWKRTFLRRGILLGIELGMCHRDGDDPMQGSVHERRAHMLLEELNWVLGKGPRPDWYEVEIDAPETEEVDPVGAYRGTVALGTRTDKIILEADASEEGED